jgi:NADH-quinone oxidoreductase subunit F
LTHGDYSLDFDSLKAAGTMLGSGAVVYMDESTCMVRNALVTTEFFAHESCGKCTPCREGTSWAVKVLRRVEAGEGRQEDMDLLHDIADGMDGRSFCPLGDAASWALRSNVKLFRDEFEAHVAEGGCPFDGDHKTLVGARAGIDTGISQQGDEGIPENAS